MRHIEEMSVYFLHQSAIHHLYTKLRGQIVEDPDIMVTDEPYYTHPAVGEFGKLAEESDKTAGHHIPVLVPIIKDVAQKVDGMGVILYRVEKIDHSQLRFPGVGKIWCSEMQVAKKIGLHQRNPSSSLASSVIMS